MEENNENYYGFEYENSDNLNQYQSSNNYNKKRMNLKIPIIILIIIILIIAIIIFTVKGCDNNNNKVNNTDNNIITTLSLAESNIEMIVGESKTIDIIIEATNPNAINFNWISSNESVATVNNGVVTALSKGEATIIASHTTNSGKAYELRCEIIVEEKNNNHDDKPTLKYSVSDKNWTNRDVTITINTTSFKEIKYAINCSKNCKYQKITSNKIVVKQNGINKVSISATDNNNKTINETITVKIDKNNPTLTLNSNSKTIYGNTNKIQVCATCTDNESGCAEEKVCDEYTSSINNVCLSVKDKVGNMGSSPSFNVVIDKDKPTCVFSGPSSSSIEIGKTDTFNLKCTDKTSGIRNRNLNASDFKINTSGIIKIEKVNKKAITNGYNYEITVTALADGKTTITLSDNIISDNAGNKQTSITSNSISVAPSCTRKASCGCEYFTAWTLKGKVTRSGSCSSPPNLIESTERWINCGNVTSASGGTCNYTCDYSTRTCSTYKCC